MLIVEVKNKDGLIITVLTATSKTFKTGPRGYHGVMKVEIDGIQYQINLVEIGSKNKAETTTLPE